jgi:hypothetical protein
MLAVKRKQDGKDIRAATGGRPRGKNSITE